MNRCKGTLSLAFDAVGAGASMAEKAQSSVASRCFGLLRSIAPGSAVVPQIDALYQASSQRSYGLVRAVTGGVRAAVEGGLAQVPARDSHEAHTPMRSDAAGSTPWLRDNVQCIVNGFVGDHLHASQNGLDLGMCLIHEGKPIEMTQEAWQGPHANGSQKLCVFVHGLSATEWSWSLFAEEFHGDPAVNFGSMLSRDLGYTPLYLRYNTGRHISQNGQALSALLTQLCDVYPHPIEEIVLLGHSMGGLVARSAAHYGASEEAPWSPQLRQVLCLGSPHLGAPLEKGAHLLGALLGSIETPGTQICAEILNTRSAGIKDLRYGYTVDEEWSAGDESRWLEDLRQDIPLVDGVGYSFFGATITKDPDHPLGQLIGDFLVRPPSAVGFDASATEHVPFRSSQVLPGMNHLHLVNHPDVYEALKASLLQREFVPI